LNEQVAGAAAGAYSLDGLLTIERVKLRVAVRAVRNWAIFAEIPFTRLGRRLYVSAGVVEDLLTRNVYILTANSTWCCSIDPRDGRIGARCVVASDRPFEVRVQEKDQLNGTDGIAPRAFRRRAGLYERLLRRKQFKLALTAAARLVPCRSRSDLLLLTPRRFRGIVFRSRKSRPWSPDR